MTRSTAGKALGTAFAVLTALTATHATASDKIAQTDNGETPMFVQIIRFESSKPRDEVLATAMTRKPQFEAIPGLRQKYYVELDAPNSYGGIYIWDNKEAMAKFRQSDLAAAIPAAYGVVGQPSVEMIDGLLQLHD